jgi:HAD superfamily hydrolase (TIGR01458 family)
MIKGVLLDIGGVVYVGEAALPGARQAVARLKAEGLPVRCITNTTRTPLAGVVARLRRMGLEVAQDDVFTPARAARAYLAEHRLAAHLLVHPALRDEFAQAHAAERTAVVVADAADGFTYAAMNEAFRKLNNGAEFLALAANRTFLDDDGEVSIDCGAFVAALEYASGRKALVLGKPSPDFFMAAVESLGCAAAETVMIGDDAEADVAGALAAGIGEAVLVRTGKYAAGDEDKVAPAPTHVAGDLAEAVDWVLLRR